MPLFDLLTDVSIRTSFATIVRQKDAAGGQDGVTEKGRRNDPTALKHGSAVGYAAAGSCFHAVTGIADIIGGRSPERNSPTS
jgi:hypothetical protein